MGQMLAQLWRALGTLFLALENSAATLNNIATVGNEMSAAYLDEERAKRQIQLNALTKQVEASK